MRGSKGRMTGVLESLVREMEGLGFERDEQMGEASS